MEYEVINPDGITTPDGHFADPGAVFARRDVEPDLLQNWLLYGHVAPLGEAPAADELPTEDEPEVLEGDADEAPDEGEG